MTDAATTRHLIKGIVLMAIAMLSIPMVDGTAKHLGGTYSPLFVSFMRYVVAACIALPIAMFFYGKKCLPSSNMKAHLARTLFLVLSMSAYFLAIAKVDLATAASAFFIGPIIATLLAIMLLGEKLTIKKGLSLLLGFGGALIIVQPGFNFSYGVILALFAGLFFAFYIVATRQASKNSDPVKTLAFQCLAGSFFLVPQGLWTFQWIDVQDVPFFVAMGILSVCSHLLSITAFRYAEASILAPLVYLELIGSVAIGYFFFDEWPSILIWFGASLIVLGGLLLLTREKGIR